ncbi:MAG: PD-(D/E)XK nuclease family transposase [Microscillaceae bacterium]|nr:PD-(D/E)XK nuclease family transposase [Microscillaceae bacterium]
MKQDKTNIVMLARLDNEVFFKKAFTDEIVFKAFVKDIVGIEVEPTKIETEKAFQPKLGNIAFKYDIFAEDVKRRIVIEIQKVEYDHNFDRFLHYHLQAITQQQHTSEDYSVEKTVYTIVVMTAPYKINTKTKEIYKDEVLISNLNPKNLLGLERKIFNHELIYLNPNYKGRDTPQNYRDWLDLIYESIHNPENPQINIQNEGVRRAVEVVSYENISPEEWEEAKIEASKRQVITLEREEERNEIAKKLLQSPLSNEEISKYTGLTVLQIEQLRNETTKN